MVAEDGADMKYNNFGSYMPRHYNASAIVIDQSGAITSCIDAAIMMCSLGWAYVL